MNRRFKTIKAYSTEDLDILVNSFATKYHIISVDVRSYDGIWYAFILFEGE